jgi:dephospho-CoA kinase
MLKIGLTGGIGSGKTTVAKIFSTLGVPVYNADSEAKKLLQQHPPLISAVKALLGEEAYTTDQKLNTAFIASQVFNNAPLLEQYNALVHPYVFAHSESWFKQHENAPYVLKEAAILIESGHYQSMDYIIGVRAPLPLRIIRIQQRDKVSTTSIQERIKNQMSDEERSQYCHFLIDNDELQSLISQVWDIHQTLLQNI